MLLQFTSIMIPYKYPPPRNLTYHLKRDHFKRTFQYFSSSNHQFSSGNSILHFTACVVGLQGNPAGRQLNSTLGQLVQGMHQHLTTSIRILCNVRLWKVECHMPPVADRGCNMQLRSVEAFQWFSSNHWMSWDLKFCLVHPILNQTNLQTPGPWFASQMPVAHSISKLRLQMIVQHLLLHTTCSEVVRQASNHRFVFDTLRALSVRARTPKFHCRQVHPRKLTWQ